MKPQLSALSQIGVKRKSKHEHQTMGIMIFSLTAFAERTFTGNTVMEALSSRAVPSRYNILGKSLHQVTPCSSGP